MENVPDMLLSVFFLLLVIPLTYPYLFAQAMLPFTVALEYNRYVGTSFPPRPGTIAVYLQGVSQVFQISFAKAVQLTLNYPCGFGPFLVVARFRSFTDRIGMAVPTEPSFHAFLYPLAKNLLVDMRQRYSRVFPSDTDSPVPSLKDHDGNLNIAVSHMDFCTTVLSKIPHPFFPIFIKADSRPQHGPNKNVVSDDIRTGQCTSSLVPIYPHDTNVDTIPESGTSPAWPLPTSSRSSLTTWLILLPKLRHSSVCPPDRAHLKPKRANPLDRSDLFK